MVHVSEGIRGKIMFRKCCMCGKECIMTPEEYLFNKDGYKIVDRSTHYGNSNEPVIDGWCCKECGDEVLRIRDL